MARHNKWSKIKHRKAKEDKKRSKIWSACARDIILAARTGGGNPDNNLRLASAILEAKRVNMPADTISRAIKRGTGELQGADPEEVIYEGYGPGGTALLVKTLTDNRHRTAPIVKEIFEKGGGKIGAIGSVAFQFEHKGRFTIPKSIIDEESLMNLVLDAGAEDLDASDESAFEVTTPFDKYEAVKDALSRKSIRWDVAELAYVPGTTTLVDAATARKVMDLVDALEDEDDVQAVFGNFEIPDDVIAELAKG